MQRHKKVLSFTLYVAAVLALVVLASGLSDLDFAAGRPFSLSVNREAAPPLVTTLRGWSIPPQLLQLLAFFVLGVLAPLSLIHALLAPGTWRRVVRDALIMAVTLLMIYVVARSRALPALATPDGAAASPPAGAAAAMPDAFVNNPPAWAVVLVLLVVVVLPGAAIVWWQRRRRPSTLDQIAQEAQLALDELMAGAHLRDTVTRCYAEMSHILAEDRHVRREQTMTTRDFERRLAAAGLVNQHVRQLTRLFEQVRYSTHAATDTDHEAAVACLRAIALALQEKP